jgi:formylglycine-generating enzyme required for sulfatase activity
MAKRETRWTGGIALAAAALALGAAPARAATLRCAPDAVKVGNACVDKYEASVWQIPPSNKSLVKKVQAGKADLDDLTAAGAVQLGCTLAPWSDPDYPLTFPDTGNWTPVLGSDPPSPGVYAASVAGVLPSTCITWFQAEQACATAGKRLATNQEWQRAAAGSPDAGAADDNATQCETGTEGLSTDPANTGSRSACVSSWGAFDMVGNVWEWVADWGDLANGCTNWSATYGGDVSCVGGPGSGYSALPGALARGGYWSDGTDAGVFAAVGSDPSSANTATGFRCAR